MCIRDRTSDCWVTSRNKTDILSFLFWVLKHHSQHSCFRNLSLSIFPLVVLFQFSLYFSLLRQQRVIEDKQCEFDCWMHASLRYDLQCRCFWTFCFGRFSTVDLRESCFSYANLFSSNCCLSSHSVVWLRYFLFSLLNNLFNPYQNDWSMFTF